jgi:hypothetical protein
MVTTASSLDFALHPFGDGGLQTTCKFAIAIDGETVWPVRGEADVALEIQIDDLLAYLTEFWKPLMLRQVYPIAVAPSRPSDLRRDAEQRWADMPPSTVEKEEELVSAFEEAHDLASAFGGVFGLPHFWMMRSNDQMTLESSGIVWRLPFPAVRTGFSALGNKIGKILEKADAARWDAAVDAWRNRDMSDSAGLLAWSAGIERTLAQALIADGSLRPPSDFDDAADDNDELRIAARMAGALPPEQIREILCLARQFRSHDAEKLENLARNCRSHIAENFARKPPFAQGEAAALFVRERLGIPNDAAADIFAIAADLAIIVRSKAARPPTFDGLAIWGNQFGPGVFLNEDSQRVTERAMGEIRLNPGARVTLAHELCHLLVDGEHALSAVEILKARMPAGVEARARSFAGEFLLPTEAAARAWQRAQRPTNLEAVRNIVRELSESFGVTWSVAAWKLQHGAEASGGDIESTLDVVAPYR